MTTQENYRPIPLFLGADPEFFLQERKTGKIVSAHGLVPGSKDAPHYFDDGGSVQLDGLACEVGIQPCANVNQWVRGLTSVLENTARIVGPDYVFNYSPTVFFEKDYYDKQVPAQCKVLGCNPDRDAYKNGDFNKMPDIVEKNGKVMRSGGGHIHFGWTHDKDVLNDQDHLWDCLLLTRNLDAAFGIYTTYWDDDKERMRMYGAPGAFRVKPYGMEYRSPSNAWLRYPGLWNFIYTLSKYVFDVTQLGFKIGTQLETFYYDNKDGKQILSLAHYNSALRSIVPPIFYRSDLTKTKSLNI